MLFLDRACYTHPCMIFIVNAILAFTIKLREDAHGFAQEYAAFSGANPAQQTAAAVCYKIYIL